MRKTTRTLATLAILCLGAAVLVGCSSDDTITLPGGGGQQNDAPALPSTSTMKIEIDFFGVEPPASLDQASIETGKPSDMLQAATADDHSNWINAYVRALFVQLLTYDALEEPVGAFAFAIHSVPQPQDDGSYLWTYIFVEDNVEYSVFLYGTPMTDRVAWRLEVSTNDPNFLLDHFVWFEGESMKDDSGGYWQFYEPVLDAPAVLAGAAATDGLQLIRIDWANGATSTLRLEVNGEQNEDFGDYVMFSQSATTGSIDHYDAGEDLMSDITWYADGSGSLTVPDYNDGNQACWDTMQRNIDCP